MAQNSITVSKQAYFAIAKHLQQKRANDKAKLPRIFLEEKHIKNCQLVLNREKMLESIGHKENVAELGVDHGDFSEITLNKLAPQTLHLVDIWGSQRYHDGLYQGVQNRFHKEIQKGQIKIHRKKSVSAAQDFEDGSLDLVYIDTDHSYKTTKDELHAYANKIKDGGIIAGHDYVQGNWVKSYLYGVIEAVHEFCVNFDWELIYLTAETLENNSFAIRKI